MVGKGTTLARRLRPPRKVVHRSERNKPHSGRNKVNIALPFSIITAEKPTKMRVGDWASLAGLVTSVIGFSIVIRQLIRIAKASEVDQESDRANLKEPDSPAGQSSPPDAERP